MPKYKYTTINQNNQQLNGTISTPDEKIAREELRKIGLTIVSLEKISEESTMSNINRFEFEAIDKDNKKIIGSIPANDEYEAYKRLKEEYRFNVLSLWKQELPEEEKQMKKIHGIQELKELYDQEYQEKLDETESEQVKIYEKERQQLLQQVDFTIAKVKNLLGQFENDIPPEQIYSIKKFADKLLRVKNSTDLQYIKANCEELLQIFQDQERFLHQKGAEEKKKMLVTNTQKLMMGIHQIPLTSKHRISPISSLKKWAEKKKESHGLLSKIVLKFISPKSKGILKSKEEASSHQLKTIHGQLWTYIGLLIKSKRGYRKQIFQNITTLLKERKRLKDKIKTMEKEMNMVTRKMSFKPRKKARHFILKEINTFSGWLLFFYISYYFTAHYIITKDIPFEVNWNFDFYNSPLKYFIVLVFIIHGAISLKLSFFAQSTIATLFISPIALFLMLFIILNF